MYDLNESDLAEVTGTEDMPGTGVIDNPDVGTSNAAETKPLFFEYTANGKAIKEDIDTILKRASQGYNYAQVINEHKNTVNNFQREREEYEAKLAQWKQYDEYATQNPSWADHVRSTWEAKGSVSEFAEQGSTEGQGQIAPELKSFMDEYRRDKELSRQAEEDRILHDEIETVRKEFPDYDLMATDPDSGRSLEMKILEHARANGINSFKAAFKDMLFDDLVAKKVTAAKEAAAKELSERTKKGILNATNMVTASKSPNPAQKRGSYHDALLDGARELGII